MRLHHLRHAHVALLLGEDIKLRAISPHLGHDKPSTTSDVCDHLIDNEDAEAAVAIGEALRKLSS